ncbi:MAG: ATP-dependent Clp protease adaptor ClpS [Phycisphaeraceae bacterium]|nr:ATP-dependent Clp protease adaptor ClpS [Phycisphaeraceae bacterium]
MAQAQSTKPAPRPKLDPEQPRLWNVVLLNDEEHTYEYVIKMVQELFAHPVEKAFKIAKTVDTDGRAVCLTTHREHAELKQEQVHAYGRDPLMVESKGSMSCIIEPADLGSDDDEDRDADR